MICASPIQVGLYDRLLYHYTTNRTNNHITCYYCPLHSRLQNPKLCLDPTHAQPTRCTQIGRCVTWEVLPLDSCALCGYHHFNHVCFCVCVLHTHTQNHSPTHYSSLSVCLCIYTHTDTCITYQRSGSPLRGNDRRLCIPNVFITDEHSSHTHIHSCVL